MTNGLQLTPHLDQYPNADILWCQVYSSFDIPGVHQSHNAEI